MKKLIFLFFTFFLLVQVFSLNQIFYSSAQAEERSVTVKEKRGVSSVAPSHIKAYRTVEEMGMAK